MCNDVATDRPSAFTSSPTLVLGFDNVFLGQCLIETKQNKRDCTFFKAPLNLTNCLIIRASPSLKPHSFEFSHIRCNMPCKTPDNKECKQIMDFPRIRSSGTLISRILVAAGRAFQLAVRSVHYCMAKVTCGEASPCMKLIDTFYY
jgi:hypothetical protein